MVLGRGCSGIELARYTELKSSADLLELVFWTVKLIQIPSWLADRRRVADILKHLSSSLPSNVNRMIKRGLLNSIPVNRLYPHLLVPVDIYLTIFIGS